MIRMLMHSSPCTAKLCWRRLPPVLSPSVLNAVAKPFHGWCSHLRRYSTPSDMKHWDSANFSWSRVLQETVTEDFGIDGGFRPMQRAIMNASLAGYSVLANLPTGSGKSLCFQAPAIVAGGVTVVVSPLLSLIQDQVSGLRRLGIDAINLSGDLSPGELANQLNRLKNLGETIRQERQADAETEGSRGCLVYLTPERLTGNETVENVLDDLNALSLVKRFVIDEAHCVSEWGTGFRPAYREMCSVLNTRFPDIPITLATATASEDVLRDLLEVFHLSPISISLLNEDLDEDKYDQPGTEENENHPVACTANLSRQLIVFRREFDRTNLSLKVVPKGSKNHVISSIWQAIRGLTPSGSSSSGSVIIYGLTRTEAEEVAEGLKGLGISAASYHSGLSKAKKSSVHKLWMGNRIQVLCATVAFGLGIDKDDVRLVVHSSLPLSINQYCQQIDIGRAIGVIEHSPSYSSKNREDLDLLIDFCNIQSCRRKYLADYLGYSFDEEECCKLCNCGESLMLDEGEEEEEQEAKRETARKEIDLHLEFFHQRLKKEFNISRKVLKRIREVNPATKAELASIKGLKGEIAEELFPVVQEWLRSRRA